MERALDEQSVAATVIDEGDKGGGADGLEIVAHDPRLMWTDTMLIATDGYLYVTANQLHRQAKYQKGKDLRRKPYTLFRIRIDAQPVLLR